MAQHTPSVPGPPHFRGSAITGTPQSVGLLWTNDRPGAVSLPDNAQHSQETDIHVGGGIRTRNPSRQAAADPPLRPRGHQFRRYYNY